MTSLWLVTPVHGRVELTRICLEQRQHLLLELAGLGVDARQVIVGDDANLDTARELGMQTLERPNVLGLRINDGIEWACREGGADHVVYAGSDSWLLPEWLADLPTQGRARASRWITFVDGKLIIPSERSPAMGHPPWTLSRGLLEPLGFRPAPNDAVRGLDTAIANRLPLSRREAFEFRPDDDPLRVVEFRGGPWQEQMTPWRLLASTRYARPNPFEVLATRYPHDLVARMEEFYAK